ncbi:MAG: insulinase family protein [Candidatus Pacebacteria bacterium]|nr:insulinase family protein [Candidatus Paceibacterota bacterium]
MKHTKTVLDNGVNIITVPLENSPTVSVMVFTGASPLRETKDNNGISHFLEHMILSGSRKWPTLRDVSLQVDSIGAIRNGMTYKDCVQYKLKAHSKYAMDITDMVCDFFRYPTLDTEKIEKERKVILSEIDRSMDSPGRILYQDFSKLLYGDQPAGWKGVGEKEVVKNISRDQLLAYHADNYAGESTTFVIAGAGFVSDDVISQVREYFSDLPCESKTQKYFVEKEQKRAGLSFVEKDLKQVQLLLGFRAYPYRHPNIIILNIIRGILGTGASSRLLTKIRQEMGACYRLKVYTGTHHDFGNIRTITGVAPERILEVAEVIMNEYKRMVNEKVSQEELEKAKNLQISNMYMSLENVWSYSSWYGWQDFYGQDIISHEQREEQIKAVTAEDIQRVAKDVFVENKLNASFVGNINDEQKEQLTKIITMDS